jgi:hypothetical protein
VEAETQTVEKGLEVLSFTDLRCQIRDVRESRYQTVGPLGDDRERLVGALRSPVVLTEVS